MFEGSYYIAFVLFLIVLVSLVFGTKTVYGLLLLMTVSVLFFRFNEINTTLKLATEGGA